MYKGPGIGILAPSYPALPERRGTLHSCSPPSFGYATNGGWPKHLLMAKAGPWNTLPWNDSTHSFISSSRKGNKGSDREEESIDLDLRLYTENKTPSCWQNPRGENASVCPVGVSPETHLSCSPMHPPASPSSPDLSYSWKEEHVCLHSCLECM